MITNDNIFQACVALKHIYLVEGALLHKTIAALYFEEWRKDMIGEIDSINQILPNADAGGEYDYYTRDYSPGEKAQAIRRWIRSLLRNITRYQAEHQLLLNEAASTLQLALPQDIVLKKVLSFFDLPPHTFEVEEDEDEDYWG